LNVRIIEVSVYVMVAARIMPRFLHSLDHKDIFRRQIFKVTATAYSSVLLSYVATGVECSFEFYNANGSIYVVGISVSRIMDHGLIACVAICTVEFAVLGDVGPHLI
jgi:Zn-dependent protease